MLEFILPGISNQLHLLGRPGPSGESPTNQGGHRHQESITTISISSSTSQLFSKVFSVACVVDFSRPVEIREQRERRIRRLFRARWSVETARSRSAARAVTGLPFVVLEEFHLAQPLGGFFARLVRSAQVFPFFL